MNQFRELITLLEYIDTGDDKTDVVKKSIRSVIKRSGILKTPYVVDKFIKNNTAIVKLLDQNSGVELKVYASFGLRSSYRRKISVHVNDGERDVYEWEYNYSAPTTDDDLGVIVEEFPKKLEEAYNLFKKLQSAVVENVVLPGHAGLDWKQEVTTHSEFIDQEDRDAVFTALRRANMDMDQAWSQLLTTNPAWRSFFEKQPANAQAEFERIIQTGK